MLSMFGVAVLLLAAWPAFSQQGPQGRYGQRGGQMAPPPGQAEEQSPDRRAGKMGQRPHMDRMTPEDRRLLRQDVRQHGRELYRGRRGQGRQ